MCNLDVASTSKYSVLAEQFVYWTSALFSTSTLAVANAGLGSGVGAIVGELLGSFTILIVSVLNAMLRM